MNDWIGLHDLESERRWKVPVLWEDAGLFVINKPPGVKTAPDQHAPDTPDLNDLLQKALAERPSWVKSRNLTFLKSVHFLDAEASGILVFAKNQETRQTLSNAFGSEKHLLRFSVLVHGICHEDAFTARLNISPQKFQPHKMAQIARGGKKSITQVRVLRRFRHFTWLECSPLTHRKHQIRVHLKSRGLTVVADDIYGGSPLFLSRLKRRYRPKGNGEERPLIPDLALHAEVLSIPHPGTGEPLQIQAPLPKGFQVGLKYLDRFDAPSNGRQEAPASEPV